MSDSRAKIWFSSFVLVVFLLGGVIGFGIGSRWPGRPNALAHPGASAGEGPDGFRRGGPGPGPRRGGGPIGRGAPPLPLRPEMVDRLREELNLDAAQQDQVKKILEDRRARLDALHEDAQQKFEKEQQDLLAAIRGVLRADQQQSFEEFLKRRQGRGRGPRDGGRGGPGPGR